MNAGTETAITLGADRYKLNGADVDVTVHDTLGRKVASLTEYADEVTLELDSGVYVLDAADRRSRLTSKISIR